MLVTKKKVLSKRDIEIDAQQRITQITRIGSCFLKIKPRRFLFPKNHAVPTMNGWFQRSLNLKKF